ncbi:monooxygenase, putative [Serinicoccus hydrothermalis]|uniref:Monooxygenase, putative n=1 Tax=Serinicoccus hydrothermalis TaxID=1758689 RepID=A0A1B1NC03_9MICO|nr:ArsO family NAD(P)H-dependent flavin-containing monooxygenase [Serinicoccus hydrothermalis]ANS78980.1 monooxygenase, putative [Serinicoccus hydrothermalis]
MSRTDTDALVVGGGQAALAASYYLRRQGVEHVLLDAAPDPGGAWRHTWPSLRLFSPAAYSSLPGWRMPPTEGEENPDAGHVIDYLTRYEERYDVPVRRPVRVLDVRRRGEGFEVSTDSGSWRARAVVGATGTWSRPFVPAVPGLADFRGLQLHSGGYAGPRAFAGKRVLVVGGANSGAQIATDLLPVAEVTWATLGEPRYLPDHVDGRELFRVASARLRGEGEGVGSLGDIVAVPPVREARDRGSLVPGPMVRGLTRDGAVGADGVERPVDAVIWCTGFRPELSWLSGIEVPRREGRPVTDGTPVVPDVPGLFLLGYGDWCGAASATLIGVGQWARLAAERIRAA